MNKETINQITLKLADSLIGPFLDVIGSREIINDPPNPYRIVRIDTQTGEIVYTGSLVVRDGFSATTEFKQPTTLRQTFRSNLLRKLERR